MCEQLITIPSEKRAKRSFRVAVCGSSKEDVIEFVNTFVDCLVYKNLHDNNNLALAEIFSSRSGVFSGNFGDYKSNYEISCNIETPNSFPVRVPSLNTDIYIDSSIYFNSSFSNETEAVIKHLCGSDCAIIVDSEMPPAVVADKKSKLQQPQQPTLIKEQDVFSSLSWESKVTFSNFSPMVKTLHVPYNWKSVMANNSLTKESRCSYIFAPVFNAATFLNNLRPGEITKDKIVDGFESVKDRASIVLSKINTPPTSGAGIEILEVLNSAV